MAYGNISKSKAEKENRLARGIPDANRRIRVEDLFLGEVSSDDSFILNGSPVSHECRQLFRVRLEQLFYDESIADRPVIVIGEHLPGEFLEQVPIYQRDGNGPEDSIYLIDHMHKFYDPFLGMDRTRIEEVIVHSARLHKREVSEEEKTVFQGVCKLLEMQGYELSLYNLMKMYGVNEQKSTKDILERLKNLLQSGGYEAEAEPLYRDPLHFSKMQATISLIYENLQPFFDQSGMGVSILQKVREAEKKGGPMPFFCFHVTDGTREDFLEYLTGELKAIAQTWRPIILVNGLKISKREDSSNSFYRYLKESSEISLNLVAQDCPSLFPDPQRDLSEMIGNYGFVMFLTNSGLNSEILTKNLGTYQHKIVGGHQEEQREWLSILPHGVGKGLGEHEEARALIRQEDISKLGPRECYLYRSRTNTVTRYRRIVYK